MHACEALSLHFSFLLKRLSIYFIIETDFLVYCGTADTLE